MIKRSVVACLAVFALSAGSAEAVTIRDVIELSKAGLSDQVLLALIEVDHSIFSIDAAALQQLKKGGVSDAVIVAMIRSGRTAAAPEPPVSAQPPAQPADPQAEALDMSPEPPPRAAEVDEAQPAPVPYSVAVPVPVPVFVPVPAQRPSRQRQIETTIQTDAGLVKARVPLPPNCVKAEPVYWGFGGKLRPGSWQPPPTVVCR
jgi:hypothetical protein